MTEINQVNSTLENAIALDAAGIERTVEALRGIVADGEVSIKARRIRYATGQRFLDHIADLRADCRRDDVEP